MKYPKKLFRVLFIFCIVTLLVLNLTVLTSINRDNNVVLNHFLKVAFAQTEYPDGPGSVGTTERCRLELGGGWFTSSIKYVCWDCYVCPSCTCTPRACGEYLKY